MTKTGGVTVQLDRERRLRYTIAAIEEIQERFDVNLIAGEELSFDSMDDMVWLICLGLRHAGEIAPPSLLPWWERVLVRVGLKEPPTLTPSIVSRWIDLQNIDQLADGLGRAMGMDEGADLEELEEQAGNPTSVRVGAGSP